MRKLQEETANTEERLASEDRQTTEHQVWLTDRQLRQNRVNDKEGKGINQEGESHRE